MKGSGAVFTALMFLAFGAGGAWADGGICCEDEAVVTLTIETYCDVHFVDDTPVFDINLADGATSGSAGLPFYAAANTCVWMYGEVTPPPALPTSVTWSCDVDGTPVTPTVHVQFGPGEYGTAGTGMVNLHVADMPQWAQAGTFGGGTLRIWLMVDP